MYNTLTRRSSDLRVRVLWDMIPSPLFYVDILDSQISANNIVAKRIISNVYSLGVIISSAGLPKLLLFLFPCIEVINDWRSMKLINPDKFLIFIVNNVLGSLQWKMNHISYLVDDTDLEDITDE